MKNMVQPKISRIHELDALRGIAALGVVIWHYGAHFGARPLESLLFPFYNSGFLLVDFFFVLSGYVIARSYWRAERQYRFMGNLWTRIARLYPLHLVTLLATALLIWFLPMAGKAAFALSNADLKHFMLNLFLINNVGFQDGWSFNTPAWSISTELAVNVMFLAAIALRKRTALALAALSFFLLLLLFSFSNPPYIVAHRMLGIIDVNLVRCTLGFGSGVGIYLLLHHFRLDLARHAIFSTVASVAALGGLAYILATTGAKPGIKAYLLSIAVSTAVVLFIPSSRLLRQILSHKPLTYLGDISYSVYLTHYPLQLVFLILGTGASGARSFDSPLMFVLFISVVLAVSGLTYRYLELPSKDFLIDAWNRRKRRIQQVCGNKKDA